MVGRYDASALLRGGTAGQREQPARSAAGRRAHAVAAGVALVLALLAGLALGRMSPAPTAADRPVPLAGTNDSSLSTATVREAWQRLEMNEMPLTYGPPREAWQRFEMNELPALGAGGLVAPDRALGREAWQFLEMNELPAVAPQEGLRPFTGPR